MPYNPEAIIGEVLGRKAAKLADPAADGFQCPFIRKRCPKRSTNLPNEPYPVCTLWRNGPAADPEADLIFVCPKRFYAVDFLNDVIEHCWPGGKPRNPMVAPEVKMADFGNVDFVIADVQDDGEVDQFLSVELQAIDITGSAFPAYQALRAGNDLAKRPTYNFNWDNVYKRYVTQLIRKGYFHHHWKSKIVAVIPEQVYQYITQRADFIRSPDVKSAQVNIIFMTYRLEHDPTRPGQYRPKLVTVEGTSHSSLQNAILYKDAPGREAFTTQIKRSLVRAIDLADLIAVGDIPRWKITTVTKAYKTQTRPRGSSRRDLPHRLHRAHHAVEAAGAGCNQRVGNVQHHRQIEIRILARQPGRRPPFQHESIPPR